MKLKDKILKIGKNAKIASKELAKTKSQNKNDSLLAMAKNIANEKKIILEANKEDVNNAKEKNISESFIDRLELNVERIDQIINSLNEIASFKDPVGRVLDSWSRPNGLQISRVSTPLGVVGIIYESRPNVTSDAGALCLKSGNASILRGGTDSFYTSIAIHQCLVKGLKDTGITEHAIQIVDDKDREAVKLMLNGLNKTIDVIVPRGGKSLVAMVEQEAQVPVFGHLEGICHIYIDKDADKEKAVNVCVNAKMRRPGICGAVETILIHDDIAESFVPILVNALNAQACEIRGCEKIVKYSESVLKADESDWSTEYLLPIVSIKIVGNIDEALDHIDAYSSGHTESIITEDLNNASRFQKELDSAIVMHNTSTQFADGGEFGMGAEIGISTSKVHARGPVGVAQLTSFKYKVRGKGQVRP